MSSSTLWVFPASDAPVSRAACTERPFFVHSSHTCLQGTGRRLSCFAKSAHRMSAPSSRELTQSPLARSDNKQIWWETLAASSHTVSFNFPSCSARKCGPIQHTDKKCECCGRSTFSICIEKGVAGMKQQTQFLRSLIPQWTVWHRRPLHVRQRQSATASARSPSGCV
jgi:hypothetical protein